ncbi:MAG: hypothetical protein IPJ20_01640 [Flammeovirgaceae bacterium]|nr:hypothetical protein [Flammeovirgaceae bacterium]
MNKTFGLIGLAFIALASLGYAFQQKSQIDEVAAVCENEKQALIKQAQEQKLRAEEFQDLAVRAQHEAEVQRAICESLLNSKTK